MSGLGYDDGPLIPGQRYRVHDSSRPQPRVITPGAEAAGCTPAGAPADAVMLFDGSSLSGWRSADGTAAAWKVENGYAEVVPGTGNIHSAAELGDCQLHLEWASPAEISGEGQGRGNSGVFLMRRYEIQVLDCYNNPTYPDGTTGGIYGIHPPLVNACRPPGQWQSYDIVWIAPRFEGDQLVSPARATVLLNGVLLHHDVVLTGQTGHRKVIDYEAHSSTAPLELQDHSDLVRFRNIWYRPLRGYDE